VEFVHPDDLAAFRSLMPNGKVFELETEGNFLVLRYRDSRYRVKPDLFKPVDTPLYDFGQRVIVTATADEAIVDEIHWHFQRREAMFFLVQRGRRLTKRFWAEDLLPSS
jgi:hypothetical protein